MEVKNWLREIITPWVVLGAILFGTALLLISGWLLLRQKGEVEVPGQVTAALTVIPVIPTNTPFPTRTPSPTETVPSDIPPSPDPGGFTLDSYVQITGTGGDGLRLRETPGLAGKVLFLGLESEVFIVKDGPREEDGYIWIFIVAPYDTNVSGWAVSNYLEIIQNP